MNPLGAWHQTLKEKNVQNIPALLADDVVMHSPVVHTPVVGKKIVTLYLTAAFYTLVNEHFTYVRELSDANTAILEFTTEIDGIYINGVDMITWNEAGLITDFKVMVRPLKAVNMLHQKMGAMLEKMPKC
jgi:ketosteroid isomerase-like protein